MNICIEHIEANILAAKLMTEKDWHKLTKREHMLVDKLVSIGIIEHSNDNGFVGRIKLEWLAHEQF